MEGGANLGAEWPAQGQSAAKICLSLQATGALRVARDGGKSRAAGIDPKILYCDRRGGWVCGGSSKLAPDQHYFTAALTVAVQFSDQTTTTALPIQTPLRNSRVRTDHFPALLQ